MPFDHHLHGSLFQCQKCDSAFPTLVEKEEHEVTRESDPTCCQYRSGLTFIILQTQYCRTNAFTAPRYLAQSE